MEALGKSLRFFILQCQEQFAYTIRLLYSHVLYVNLHKDNLNITWTFNVISIPAQIYMQVLSQLHCNVIQAIETLALRCPAT